MEEPRFAIYFVPPADAPLYRFGAAFLGYDCYAGDDLTPPHDIELAIDDWRELTQAPRAYGFHATLKAPFHLAPNATESDLLAEFRRFAATPREIPGFDAVVRPLGPFVAIVPAAKCSAVGVLAADCVAAFDRFRRPLTAQERRSRIAAGLNQRQIENLDRWGYPNVFGEFRFHMTLAGPMDSARRDAILTLLQARFGAMCGHAPLRVGQLALLRQEAPSARFKVICHAELHSRG